ncbi:MAG: hypothetical protein QM726_02925 [Chitinophagaceae bacterium]
MARHNIFHFVHKGLKQLLYQTSGKILQTDFNNPEETAILIPQLNQALDLLYNHTVTEHAIILPAIVSAEPSALLFFEEEQSQQFSFINRMQALINIFHHAVSTEEKIEMGSAIRKAFTDLLLHSLQQMAKEELVINKLLWQFYTDTQLKSLQQKLVATYNQEDLHLLNTWMMRGLSNFEIIAWLKKIKNNELNILDKMLLLAKQELSTTRWNLIQEGITEAALLA